MNIHLIIIQLESFLQNNEEYLPLLQSQFVHELLNGRRPQGNDNGWRGLKAQAKTPNPEELKRLINAIESEIEKNSSGNDSDYLYSLRISLNHIKSMYQLLTASIPHSEYTKIYNTLYQTIIKNYNGEILLPINQGLDYRLGNSNGECAGYVAEWANCLLDGRKPFGIDPNQPAIFKPVKFDSPIGCKYPELNHLAPLSKRITVYQNLAENLNTNLITSWLNVFNGIPNGISRELLPNKIVAEKNIKWQSFYLSPHKITNELIKSINQQTNNIYSLSLHGSRTAHALGAYKDNNGKYHFIDANSGWFRFKNEAHFKAWLPIYLKHMRYERMFGEYSINSFNPENKMPVPGDLAIFGRQLVNLLYQTWRVPLKLAYYGGKLIADGIKWLVQKIRGSSISENDLINETVNEPLIQQSNIKESNLHKESYSEVAGLLFSSILKPKPKSSQQVAKQLENKPAITAEKTITNTHAATEEQYNQASTEQSPTAPTPFKMWPARY